MRAVDRAKPHTYEFKGLFDNKLPGTERFFPDDDINLSTRRDYSELIKSLRDAHSTPLADIDEQQKIEFVKFIDRVNELSSKEISSTDYKIPNLNPSDGFEKIDKVFLESSDAYDAFTNRLRPFMLGDLHFNRLCKNICMLKGEVHGPELRKKLNSLWDLRQTRNHFDSVFIKSSDFKSLSMISHVEISDSAARFIVQYPYHEDGAESLFSDSTKASFESFLNTNSLIFENNGLHMCKVINSNFILKWMNKYEWHAGEDSDYFDRFMDVETVKNIVRIFMLPALGDRVIALLCLRDILIGDSFDD